MPAPKKPTLTHEQLTKMLNYSAETGVFSWKNPASPRMRQGDIAGCKRHDLGDIVVTIGDRMYQAHRLAWMYQTGEWPLRQVRHRNGDKTDNRFSNLAITEDRGNIKDVVSLGRVKELLSYDPETGQFSWLCGPIKRRRDGKLAGAKHNKGYVTIAIDGQHYLAHRLAWFYVHAVWPKNLIDHKNLDKTDNRIVNLREATYAENSHNAGARPTNTSGYKGVSWSSSKNKWVARIISDMRIYTLGYFETPEAAHAAYVKAAKQHHGEFARPN